MKTDSSQSPESSETGKPVEREEIFPGENGCFKIPKTNQKITQRYQKIYCFYLTITWQTSLLETF
jgi:hypothetical protein